MVFTPVKWDGKPTFMVRAEAPFEVHDGDTVYVNYLDRGMGDRQYPITAPKIGLRFGGSNARELKDPGGPDARANLLTRLSGVQYLWVRTLQEDAFGDRIDGYPMFVAADGTLVDLVPELIEQQWLAPWDGTGKKGDHVPPWPRTV